jgi:hypothetical protein
MGFVSDAIGGVTDMLTGGGNKGPIGYTSPYASEYENSSRQGIYGRLGAKKKLKKGKTGAGGESDYEYDMTGTTDPMTPEQAKSGYSGFGKIQEAMDKINQSTYSPEAYQKTQYNIQSLPEKSYNLASEAGVKDLNRQGQSSLAKLQETVGTRRPGLLLKAGEQSNRDVGEQLASLQSSLRQEQMKEKTQAGKDQQTLQATENMNAAKFGESQEQYKNEDQRQRAEGYGTLANQYLGNEQTATESERAYKDKALEWLMDMFKTASGANSAAAVAGQNSADARRGQTMSMLGEMSKGGLFCLPKGTHIETDEGTRNVEDFDVGDKVKGGTVIATSRRLRPDGHKFFIHVFENGPVVMSKGHPYFDKLLNMVEVENNSPATYDILTDSGYYFVDGIKLGSTIKV